MTELSETLESLAASTRRFLATLDGLAPEQWNCRAAPEQWSIAETAEHTAVVLRGIERLFATRILTMPLAADDPGRRMRDGELPRIMADRSRLIEAPDMVRPKGRYATQAEFREAITASTEGLIAWAREHSAVLRTVGAPHPIFGPIDALQWLEFLAAHTERHARQVEGVRREGGF